MFILLFVKGHCWSLGGSNERAFNLFDQVAEKFHHWFRASASNLNGSSAGTSTSAMWEFHAVSLERRWGGWYPCIDQGRLPQHPDTME